MTSKHRSKAISAAAFVFALLVAAIWSNVAGADDPVSYKDDVFPVLELRCLSCHQPGGAGLETSGLDMTSYEGLMKGTKHGPVIVPGEAFTSNLVAVIDGRTDPELWMPHERRKMSKCERLLIRFWINQGAKNN